MKDALGLRSKSGIHRLITGLEERGFIRRLANRARAIEVIRSNETPETSAAMQIGEAANTNQVPFLGRIAAGLPIQAQFENMSTDVPPSMLSQSGKYYALEVTGDSMVGVGIITGDIAVIRETSDARDGDIVVAQIEGYEATLKTYKRDGGDVVLVSENPNYPPRRIPNGHVSIQGKMVGLIRKC